MRLFVIISALACALSSPSASAQAEQPAVPPVPEAGAQAQSSTTAVTRSAVQIGILSCAARINQLSTYLGYNDKSAALLFNPGQQQDQRLIPIVMELQGNGPTAFASLSVAPNQANGCGATYDAVVYWPQKCDAVASKDFAGFRKQGALRKDVTVLDGGPFTKVFLMAAGAGCVSIKKELAL